MCGIYGILHLDGSPVSTAALRPMGELTIHRGPDDEGMHADGPLAFGMRRLAIIDVTGGHQPLSNEARTLWLVANGEIYNYRELREELQARGHRFSTQSDCETILHLYAEHGDRLVEHLNGMYAFALWDAPRRRLLVGRDRLGVKPLYLWNQPPGEGNLYGWRAWSSTLTERANTVTGREVAPVDVVPVATGAAR